MISSRSVLVGALLGAVLTVSRAAAGPCAQPQSPQVSGVGELDIDSSTIDSGTLSKAIGDWQACPQYGTGFPKMVPNGTAGFPVSVVMHPGTSSLPSGRCGQTAARYSGNKIVGATINVYTQQANGSPCLPAYDNIAHELGHVLGEADAPAGCNGHIMGPPVNAGSPRSVYPDDCSDVDGLWLTPIEQNPPPPPNQCPPDCGCPPTCQTGCDANGVCQDDPCETDPTLPECGGGGGGGECTPSNPCYYGVHPPPSAQMLPPSGGTGRCLPGRSGSRWKISS